MILSEGSPILPDAVPGPRPSELDAPFWNACRERRLVFQRCGDCGRWRHPPAPLCPSCQSLCIRWETAGHEARVYSVTRVHAAAHPSVATSLPYTLAVVEFPECGGVRLITNLAGPETPEIGARVALLWETAEGMPVPRFRAMDEKRPGE